MSKIVQNALEVISLIEIAIKQQDDFSKKILKTLKPNSGPLALFFHQSNLIERLKDLKLIIERLGNQRAQLTELGYRENSLRPKRKVASQISKKLRAVFRRTDKLTSLMKLDLESLYIFGNLALDQIAIMIAYILNISEPGKYNFYKLASDIQTDKSNKRLNIFKKKHRKDIIWLYYQIRFYRNVFIEHIRRPWQRGTTAGVIGEDFKLFIPTPPGWIEEKKEQKKLKNIFKFAPKWLKEMPDDYWEKKSRKRTLEVTFNHIDEIEKQADREKVWKVWKELGGSTLSFDILALRLLGFINSVNETLKKEALKHPKNINLGPPN